MNLSVALVKIKLEEALSKDAFPAPISLERMPNGAVVLTLEGERFRLPPEITKPAAWCNRLMIAHMELLRPDLLPLFRPMPAEEFDNDGSLT
jgi:hypothetical protein